MCNKPGFTESEFDCDRMSPVGVLRRSGHSRTQRKVYDAASGTHKFIETIFFCYLEYCFCKGSKLSY